MIYKIDLDFDEGAQFEILESFSIKKYVFDILNAFVGQKIISVEFDEDENIIVKIKN